MTKEAATLDEGDLVIVAKTLRDGFRTGGFWGYGYSSSSVNGELRSQHHRCPHCDKGWTWLPINTPILHSVDCPTAALRRVLTALGVE